MAGGRHICSEYAAVVGWGQDVCALMCISERWQIGLPTHLDSGFRFSWNTEHSHFAEPLHFILIGAQHICNTSAIKGHPANLRV